MATYLEMPFEDETLFSVVGRYKRASPVSSMGSLRIQVFGYRTYLSVPFGYNLGYVAAETRDAWGLDAKEIAERMTAYPYYAALLPEQRATELLGAMRTYGSDAVGFASRVARLPDALRHCEQCVKQDKRAGRMPYWRRSHQLPGVVFCPWHGVILRYSRLTSRHRHGWPMVLDIAGESSEIELDLTPSQRSAAIQVADISRWLLQNRVRVCLETLESDFERVARLGGYARGATQLRYQALRKAILEFYGQSYLEWVGLSHWPTPDGRMFQRYRRDRYCAGTLATVLLAAFFGSLQERETDDAWPHCPSMVAAHGPQHPVASRRLQKGRYHANCDCGLSFTYEAAPGGCPRDVRIGVYGDEYQSAARRMCDGGMSTGAAAAALNIEVATLRKFLKGGSRRYGTQPDESELRTLYKEWTDALAEAGTVRRARIQHGRIYRRLTRYAPQLVSNYWARRVDKPTA